MSRGARSSARRNDAGALTVRFGRGIQRSITAFIVAIIVLPLISLWATYQIRTLSARVVAVEESRILAGRLLRSTIDEESALRAYLVTRRPAFLNAYRSAHRSSAEFLDVLPARFEAAGLSATLPRLHDFALTHQSWERGVVLPLIANPHRSDALALEAAGTRFMAAMHADSLDIQSSGITLVAQTTREMTDTVAASVAVAAAWVLLVALLTILFQRRAVAYESKLVETIVREREEVEHLSDWRSRLLAMLAHDFKSQLTVLIGASHLLEDFPHRRGDPELLASLRSASYMLAEMADNAILLARAQERKIVLQRTALDVGELVTAVVQRYGAEREFNVVTLPLPAAIDADRSYATRVLDNIIGNAVKYSEKPIEVRIEPEDAFVCVRVIDCGIGIAESDLPHIFEEFWRSERMSWKRNGSGVGLFIVKTIMEAHGGDITVQSRYGEGTSVTLKFPRASLPLLAPDLPPIPARY